MDTYMLQILVTGIQEDAIKDLFSTKGWKYERKGTYGRDIVVTTSTVRTINNSPKDENTYRENKVLKKEGEGLPFPVINSKNSEDITSDYNTCLVGLSNESVSGCLPPEIKSVKATEVGYSSSCSKDFMSQALLNPLTLTEGKQVYTDSSRVPLNNSNTEKTALNKPVAWDISFIDSIITDSTTLHYNDYLRQKENNFRDTVRYMATVNCLQKFDESRMLTYFEIMCEFIKKLKTFEFDRKLVHQKLKEIFEVLKYLFDEKMTLDNTCNKERMEKSSLGETKVIENIELIKTHGGETDTGNESGDCDVPARVRVRDERLLDASSEVSLSCNNIGTAGVNLENLTVWNTSINKSGYQKKMFKQSKDKRTGFLGKTEKQLTQDSAESPETNENLSHPTAKNFVTLEVGSNEQNAPYSFVNGQISRKDNRVLYQSEDTNKSVRKKSIRKTESAKFRWTVSRNMRMHKYHRKCETFPTDLDTNQYSAMEKGFYCPDCKFIFKGKNKLILHKRLKQGYCLPDCIYCDAEDQKDVFQCSKCPKCFQTKEMLERHTEKHAVFSRCNMCEAEFFNLKDLKLHTQREHAETALKMYLCDLCGAKFKERKVLNAHRKYVHSDERPEVCTSCNKRFKTKSQLKNHLVTHKDVSELNLSCEICGKLFLRVSTLKDHVRRHRKEFTCFCTLCNKGFYRKYGLEEHMRVHTGDKPFDCKICGFKCALSCNLVKHMKVHQKYNTN